MKTEPIGELIGVLFLSRDIAHREHLSTGSYAAHRALNSFYLDIIGLADKLAEAYQGCTGSRIGDIPYLDNPIKGDILTILKRMGELVSKLRKKVLPENTAIQNIMDEIEDEFYSTMYKLTFLK
jgi:hypothetical protein